MKVILKQVMVRNVGNMFQAMVLIIGEIKETQQGREKHQGSLDCLSTLQSAQNRLFFSAPSIKCLQMKGKECLIFHIYSLNSLQMFQNTHVLKHTQSYCSIKSFLYFDHPCHFYETHFDLYEEFKVNIQLEFFSFNSLSDLNPPFWTLS